MTFAISVDLGAFAKSLNAAKEKIHAAGRPAAQAGIQVIYERARLNAPVGDREHYFYGKAAKAAPPGSKKAKAYGPFKPGTLRDSIYQVYSKDKSTATKHVYECTWNRTKAPYGHMVELGTSQAPSHSFMGKALIEGRGDAMQAIKREFIERVKS
jgi:HK97 gp10 family phage protein